MTSKISSPTLDRFFKTAFHEKFAETTATSLGISRDTIRKAYLEVEGIVGYLDAAHTNSELLKKFQQEDNFLAAITEDEKKAAWSEIRKKMPKINYEKFNSLIFTDGEEWVLPHMGTLPFTEANKKDMLQYKFYDQMGDAWPKQWFRKVGDRKAQLQIPLANLLPPGLFVDQHQREQDEEGKRTNDNDDQSAQQKEKNATSPSSRSAIMLPPNLQKIAVMFEKIMSRYLEQIILDYSLIPSAIEKKLFPGAAISAEPGQENSAAVASFEAMGRSKLLLRMRSKSVLRLWIYFGKEQRHHHEETTTATKTTFAATGEANADMISQSGSTSESCRGHFDPGVCTILLSGSKPGLQIHKTFVGQSSLNNNNDENNNNNNNNNNNAASYEFATHDPKHEADEDGWMNAGFARGENETDEHQDNLDNNKYSDSNVILMNDTLMQVLTGGIARHAFHRVMDSDSGEEDEKRIQIVLEFRPDNAPKWYPFVPTDDEKERCSGF